jgi:hypothetical protein
VCRFFVVTFLGMRGLPIEFVGTPGSMSNEDSAFDAGGANDTIPYPHPPPKARDGSDEVK